MILQIETLQVDCYDYLLDGDYALEEDSMPPYPAAITDDYLVEEIEFEEIRLSSVKSA